MVDSARQVPAPSAAAWLFDLRNLGGPSIVVLRQDEAEARICLGMHLIELGVMPDSDDRVRGLTGAAVEHVGVLW